MDFAIVMAYNMLDTPYYYERSNMNCLNCDVTISDKSIQSYCSVKCKLLKGIVVSDNGCWLYRNSTSGSYSKARWNGKWHLAHRLSYRAFILNWAEIPEGKWVCHRCDVPKCINPEHLFLGTAQENAQDAVKKGRRYLKGELCPLTKFTDIQIEEMRILRQEGFTYERLVRIFNCSMSTIVSVLKNKIRKEN